MGRASGPAVAGPQDTAEGEGSQVKRLALGALILSLGLAIGTAGSDAAGAGAEAARGALAQVALPTTVALPTIPAPPEAGVPPTTRRLPAITGRVDVLNPVSAPPRTVPLTSNLPDQTECLGSATFESLGTYTGISFTTRVPEGWGDCVVPGGLVLRSPDEQDMLLISTTPMLTLDGVPTSDGSPVTLNVWGNSLDASKPGPRQGTRYSIAGLVPGSSDLGRLVWTIPAAPVDQLTMVGMQAAVWAITNDLTADQLRAIVPATTVDLASAHDLLTRAGLNPQSRALFRQQ